MVRGDVLDMEASAEIAHWNASVRAVESRVLKLTDESNDRVAYSENLMTVNNCLAGCDVD